MPQFLNSSLQIISTPYFRRVSVSSKSADSSSLRGTTSTAGVHERGNVVYMIIWPVLFPAQNGTTVTDNTVGRASTLPVRLRSLDEQVAFLLLDISQSYSCWVGTSWEQPLPEEHVPRNSGSAGHSGPLRREGWFLNGTRKTETHLSCVFAFMLRDIIHSRDIFRVIKKDFRIDDDANRLIWLTKSSG